MIGFNVEDLPPEALEKMKAWNTLIVEALDAYGWMGDRRDNFDVAVKFGGEE